MKCKINLSTNRTFSKQSEAREYLKKLVEAGVLFITCKPDDFDDGKTIIQVNETTYYQTQTLARESLQEFIRAGILYLKVERDREEEAKD